MMYKNYRAEELSKKSTQVGIVFDVMVTGVTGAGKSTTLNALFQKEVATVGRGVDPETMDLDSYRLNDSFRLWDTPGLGDGKQKDKEHAKLLIDLLYKDYGENNGWIDLVLVIIEGSNRDMGTTYRLLNDIIVPNIERNRILIAVNQADVAMKGRYWDYDSNKPKDKLKSFLDEQAESIQRRVKEATGVNVLMPIYYSAEYGYNVDKLMDLLIDNMPSKKRDIVV
ncbi:GTP-binding protein HSR1 [Shewanella algae]|uniref:GTPase family protein n=1 Tax=Shewanella algae TaxID=38313 RepID=UPI0008DDF145|nr:GTPase [Shewanella algae]OHY54573.1 GTP-binding protein HSR1 [Shewanella algae]